LKKKNEISVKLFLFAALFTITVIFFSCTDNKISVTRDTDIQHLPTLTAKFFETEYTDSAKLQVVMSAPLVEKYSTIPPPYWEFLYGIKIKFYEGKPEPEATLSAKYAKFHVDKNLWELRDSVIAESDKKLETELLYWDKDKDLVYTERFVKITSDDEIVMGTGFESNSRFDSYTIKNTTMTIYR
jgi:LPS export ABC transporter protein LptC